MQLISEYFEEHHKRWNRIGHVCGFNISSPSSKSPASQSPRGPTSIVGHEDFRYPSRSFFQQHHRFSSSSSSFQLPDLPATSRDRPRGQSLPRSTLPQSVFRKRHSMPVVPIFKDPPSMTNSIESTSSSSSSVSQLSSLIATKAANYRSMSLSGRATGEEEELPQRAYTDGVLSERGNRNGGVAVGGGGRSSSGDSLEKKPMVDWLSRKTLATPTTLEEVTNQSSAEVCPSPKASPPVRSRVKQISTNV